MSEPTDLTVRTEADYKRNAVMASAAYDRVLEKARNEAWPIKRRDEALVEAILPYYRANTDPASPAASKALLDEYLKEQGKHAEVLDAQENPKLHAVLIQQTNTLNAVHGVKYAPPSIVIVDGLMDDKNTPLQYDNGAILIDKAFFAEHVNDPNFTAGIAHELGHRYQRSDDELRLVLMLNELNIVPSDADLATSRNMELNADVDAHRVTKQGMLNSFLKNAVRSDALALGYYMANNPNMALKDVVNRFLALGYAQQQALINASATLPAAAQETLITRGIQAIDAGNHDLLHPKLEDRFALQDALYRNPVVLSCQNIQFDGDTHIIVATSCGPKNVPLIVDGLPTGERVRK